MHKFSGKASSIFIVTVALIGTGALVASTSSSFAKNEKVSEKSGGSYHMTEKSKVNVKQEVKNFEKADRKSEEGSGESVMSGKSNAALHKEKVEVVAENLDKVVKKEKEMKKTAVAQQIEGVVEESSETSNAAADAIAEVESRNGFKRFLIGTDYKNLGQLRSSLVRNESQIRKLTRAMAGVDAEEQAAIGAQLLTLTQERERIKTVITENEGGFSLLGWMFRLINGYPKESIDPEAEDVLTQDVQNALDSEAENSGDSTEGAMMDSGTSETVNAAEDSGSSAEGVSEGSVQEE